MPEAKDDFIAELEKLARHDDGMSSAAYGVGDQLAVCVS